MKTIATETRLTDALARYDTYREAARPILDAATPLLHEWPADQRLRFLGHNWGGDWDDVTGADINGAPAEYCDAYMSPVAFLEQTCRDWVRSNPLPDCPLTVADYAEWLNTFLRDEFEAED